jgi:hypothetical protein
VAAEGGGVRILTPAEIASVNAHHRSPHLAELYDALARVRTRVEARATERPERAEAIRQNGTAEIRVIERKIARLEGE